MTTCLPFEILSAIFEQCDDVRDLRHARATNRTFCAIASPLAFRVLSVTNTGGSAQNLGRLFDVPEIAAYVREVAYCDTGADERGLIQVPLLELESIRTSAIPELARSFSRIHQLLRLETINLTLVPDSGRHPYFGCEGPLALQASILGALADSFSIRAPSKLTSLSLKNLRTWDLTPLESAPFQIVLKNLRRLQLSMVYECPECFITSPDRWLSFRGILFVLAPTQHTLMELTLEYETHLAASSRLSFAGLHFPYLCVLSLRNIIFGPSVGVESFILRHAATLARLELIMCRLRLNTESSARPIYWAHIWDSFAVELTALVALRVDAKGGDSSEYRYVRRILTAPNCRTKAPEHVDVADDAALRRFYVAVAARSKEACNTS